MGQSSEPSISVADISAGWLNLTNAPPSLSRGMISVTFMGSDFGIALLTMLIGSRIPVEEFSNFLSSLERSRSVCHGPPKIELSLRGKISI